MTDSAGLWSALAVPTEAVSARLHPESDVVWLGIDSSGRRHLLVSASGEDAGQHLLTTHGLNATTERLSIEGAAPDVWVDIVCLNEALNETFSAVADDLIAETKSSPADSLGGVRQVLRKWKWFWGVDASGLSDEAALGIFGELWFLDRWAGLPGAVESWLGPTGSRHDFVSPSVSVEVKATRVRADGPARHRITSLDQLADPESGALYLFSLTVTPDANASNSLPTMVGLIRTRLHEHPEVLELFDQRLAGAGWTPAAAEKHGQRFRVRAEELYRVEGDFPRLTDQSFPHGLPAGVDNVTYTVDLAACVEYRSATTPEHAAALLVALAT
jgi:hypothetical protein